MRRRHFAALGLAVLLALSLAGCGGEKAEEERTSGLYYEACGISPDAVLLTVDGREVPAWRYLYWLTWGCDQLSEAYDEAGLTLDWSETVEGTDLAAYVRQQALDNTVLYATVENWAEQYQVEITEADQPELDSLWAKQAEEAGGEEEYLAQMADRAWSAVRRRRWAPTPSSTASSPGSPPKAAAPWHRRREPWRPLPRSRAI